MGASPHRELRCGGAGVLRWRWLQAALWCNCGHCPPSAAPASRPSPIGEESIAGRAREDPSGEAAYNSPIRVLPPDNLRHRVGGASPYHGPRKAGRKHGMDMCKMYVLDPCWHPFLKKRLLKNGYQLLSIYSVDNTSKSLRSSQYLFDKFPNFRFQLVADLYSNTCFNCLKTPVLPMRQQNWHLPLML